MASVFAAVHRAHSDPIPLGRLIAMRLGTVILIYGPWDSSSLLFQINLPPVPLLEIPVGERLTVSSASRADVTYDAWILLI